MARNHTRKNPRIARTRYLDALDRPELRQPSIPRVSAVGVTSAPINAEDPKTRRLIDEALAKRTLKALEI
jgi:hypothetical protein